MRMTHAKLDERAWRASYVCSALQIIKKDVKKKKKRPIMKKRLTYRLNKRCCMGPFALAVVVNSL